MKILITGGTGFIGSAVVREMLRRGHEAVMLSRSEAPRGLPPGARAIRWTGRGSGAWTNEINGAHAIINLAGEPIAAGRWTTDRKRTILSSRLEATAAIVDALRGAKQRPKVLVSASASGYYGNVPSGDVLESSPRGVGFLADVAAMWEAEALKAQELGVRVVLPRISVVLAKDGGALPRLLLPFRLYAGGHLGTGRQYFPWIHRDDLVGLILYALQTPSLTGPVNANSPEIPTMREFCRILGATLGRPSWMPIPSMALKLVVGEMATMLLDGQKMVPGKALEAGYKFLYPTLREALRVILQ